MLLYQCWMSVACCRSRRGTLQRHFSKFSMLYREFANFPFCGTQFCQQTNTVWPTKHFILHRTIRSCWPTCSVKRGIKWAFSAGIETEQKLQSACRGGKGVEEHLHSFLPSALVDCELSASRLGRLRPGTQWMRGCVGTRASLDGRNNRKASSLVPHKNGTPVHLHLVTWSIYWLSYTGSSMALRK